MKETCTLCPSVTCLNRDKGRVVIHELGKRSITLVPIQDCTTRESALNKQLWDLLQIEEATGHKPPSLLGC